MMYNLALKVKRNYIYESWFASENITNYSIYGDYTS